MSQRAVLQSVVQSTVVVAVDVGKKSFAVSVSGADRRRLLGPVEVAMTRPGLDRLVERVRAVLPGPECAVRVGVEAAGHYHQPLITASGWPAGWQVWQLNPAHVTEQRRVMGRRRVKTDAIDLEAITELLLAGRGQPVTDRPQVLGELAAWAAHRTRRVAARTATKNQLLGQLDRAFPGLSLVLPDVLGTKAGRLVAEHFTDPARLAALGPARLVRFAAVRGLRLRRSLAERLVHAAGNALPTRDAAVARRVLATDLALLTELDAHVLAAEAHLARLLPLTPFRTLTSVPGWGVVRAGNYAAALGDPNPLARTIPDLPRRRTVPDSVRIRRPPPRRRYQPRRQRPAAPRADRSRSGAVADRQPEQGLRRSSARPRQARRHHHLRAGSPRQPDRLRPGPRPDQLPAQPLDPSRGVTAPPSQLRPAVRR